MNCNLFIKGKQATPALIVLLRYLTEFNILFCFLFSTFKVLYKFFCEMWIFKWPLYLTLLALILIHFMSIIFSADGMMFGPLACCPICSGSIRYSGGMYRCHGYVSEWSKCSYSTNEPKRVRQKWKVPEGTDNHFLKQVCNER